MKRLPWSAEDRQRLVANYNHMDIADLCELLGRTQGAIWQEATRRGLQRRKLRVYAPTHGLWDVVFERRAYL